MDLVDYSQEIFKQIKQDYEEKVIKPLLAIGYRLLTIDYIPISALDGISTLGVIWAFTLVWVITTYQVYLLIPDVYNGNLVVVEYVAVLYWIVRRMYVKWHLYLFMEHWRKVLVIMF